MVGVGGYSCQPINGWRHENQAPKAQLANVVVASPLVPLAFVASTPQYTSCRLKIPRYLSSCL